MTEDLHPYDGRTRRFRHTDADPQLRARGLTLIAGLLRLPAPPPALRLRYDLSFYSGGDGIFDRLRIALACAPDEADAIVARRGFLAPDGPWTAGDRESLEWLVCDEDHPERTFAAAAAAFVAAERAEFQPPPDDAFRVWFAPGSDVNGWALIYAVAGELGYMAHAHG